MKSILLFFHVFHNVLQHFLPTVRSTCVVRSIIAASWGEVVGYSLSEVLVADCLTAPRTVVTVLENAYRRTHYLLPCLCCSCTECPVSLHLVPVKLLQVLFFAPLK